MSVILRLITMVLVVLSMFPKVSFASQCLASSNGTQYTIADISKGFCITFILIPDERNRILFFSPMPDSIWSDNKNPRQFKFSVPNGYHGSEHTFRIKFEPTGQMRGKLSYYIDDMDNARQSLDYTFPTNRTDILLFPSSSTPNQHCITAGACPSKTYPTDAHYEFGVHTCSSMPCTIPITRTDYRNAPLVFVMPTVDTTNPDSDAPSRLYISSELKKDSTSFTVQQHSLRLSNRFYKKPMTEISYFIMEPGATMIDGHKVIAGFVETNKYKGRNKPSREWGSASVPFSDFDSAFTPFTHNDGPVILHQLQTNKNGNLKWVTSGRDETTGDNKEKVALFLELSRSISSNYQAEKIAFLATEPTPKKLSIKQNGDDYHLFFNLSRTETQPKSNPFNRACNQYVANSPLNKINGILLKRQQRSRPDGGWLRRCKIDDGYASVVIDEDHYQRSHMKESIGYLAFEKVVLPKICDYVPEGLQTTVYDNGKPYGLLRTSGSFYSKSTFYLAERKPNFSFGAAINQNYDGFLCKYPDNDAVEACFQGDKFGNNDPAEFINSDKIHPSYPVVLPAFQSGTTDIVCHNECPILPAGSYKSVVLNNSSTLRLAGGEYWIDSLDFGWYSKLKVLAPSVIHFKGYITDYFAGQEGIHINAGGNPHDLLFIGHGSTLFWLHTRNHRINAFIYSPSGLNITSEDTRIKGGLAASDITLGYNNLHFYAQSCQAPPAAPKITQLRIKPNNYHLTCENDDKKIVEVQMLDKDGNLVVGAQSSLTLTQEGGTNLNITLDSEKDGVAKFKVATTQPSAVGEYDLKASLTVNGTVLTDTAKIKYVPFKFEAADQQVVAGKNNKVSIAVKACALDGKEVTTGYTGQPTVDFTYLLDTLKGSGVKDASDLVFAPQFTGGSASADMYFKESGKIKVTLHDTNFTCDPTQFRCPMNGGALKGEFEVSARPWKIAICDIKSKSNNKVVNPATKESGKGFIASGETFVTTYRPVLHPDSSSGYQACDNNYPITANYGLDNGPLGIINGVAYPTSSSASMGWLAPRNRPVAFDKDHRTYTFDHSWNEVGTMRITTSANYLGMKLDTDTQEVGRFYPKYFKVLDGVNHQPKWDYPGTGRSEQDFVYMNQPFDGVTFYVEALNAQELSLHNYGLFDSSLTADFTLHEPNLALAGRFNSGTNRTKSWHAASWKSIGKFDLKSRASTDCSTQVCWAKKAVGNGYEDGPFNVPASTLAASAGTAQVASSRAVSTISIQDTGSTDPIVYPKGGTKLSVQPSIYFGRAVMDSVGGVTGNPNAMTIPLRIEYWQGARFVTHEKDNASNIQGVNTPADNRNIWPSSGAKTVQLGGGGPVVKGRSRSITVQQQNPVTSEVRQQTQVWLELNSATNEAPWLRYRWQDPNRAEVGGEEDPSTVVTFGIHRGNDRVIYRGESGLIGQQ